MCIYFWKGRSVTHPSTTGGRFWPRCFKPVYQIRGSNNSLGICRMNYVYLYDRSFKLSFSFSNSKFKFSIRAQSTQKTQSLKKLPLFYEFYRSLSQLGNVLTFYELRLNTTLLQTLQILNDMRPNMESWITISCFIIFIYI